MALLKLALLPGARTEVGGSKLRLAHMVNVPLELMRISARYNRTPPHLPTRDARTSTRSLK